MPRVASAGAAALSTAAPSACRAAGSSTPIATRSAASTARPVGIADGARRASDQPSGEDERPEHQRVGRGEPAAFEEARDDEELRARDHAAHDPDLAPAQHACEGEPGPRGPRQPAMRAAGRARLTGVGREPAPEHDAPRDSGGEPDREHHEPQPRDRAERQGERPAGLEVSRARAKIRDERVRGVGVARVLEARAQRIEHALRRGIGHHRLEAVTEVQAAASVGDRQHEQRTVVALRRPATPCREDPLREVGDVVGMCAVEHEHRELHPGRGTMLHELARDRFLLGGREHAGEVGDGVLDRRHLDRRRHRQPRGEERRRGYQPSISADKGSASG
jgi:hypothetical protein